MERREGIDGERHATGETREESRAGSPLARAVADWLQQLGRTLKTCRLYDAANPTVVTFRHDLAASLQALLQEHGAFEVGFTPESIFLGDAPLYAARSREDNLALPFFRDGIRALTVQPGVEPREVNALVDCLLTVTRSGSDDLDLVTAIWECGLDHVAIRYVSMDGDVESGAEGAGESDAELAAGSIAPFPRNSGAPAGDSSPAAGGAFADDTGRSDDLITAGRAREIETALIKMEIVSQEEVERVRHEFETESAAPLARRALRLMAACFDQAVAEPDRQEFREFVPRLLHDAVSHGDWREAHECLVLLHGPTNAVDAVAVFAADLAREGSATSRNGWQCLERQPAERQDAFFELVRAIGIEATEWLMQGLAECSKQSLRKRLAKAIAEIAAPNPERLAPWLADERWYVVRNVVHLLGLMEGPAPVGLLRAVANHAEYRVRREVVSTLARAPREEARPLLLEMLEQADPRLFGAILQQMSSGRDPAIAAMLVRRIAGPDFAARPEDERRAIYQALGSVGGDDVVPLLEEQVRQGNWLAHGDESSRLAAVMCLARIGTPAARAVLENGARSRRAEIARACRAGLASQRPKEGEARP